jgi:radical SAM superfamily enzyme YgiQ (UPF0313 family)
MTKIGLMLAFDRESEIQRHHPPLALGYLASYLRSQVQDVDVRFFLTPDEAAEFEPELVGISSVTQNLSIAARMAEALKGRIAAPIMLGGIHISLLPETLPKAFDFGVIGEGERTLVDLVRWRQGDIAGLAEIPGLVVRQGDGLVTTHARIPITNLDEIPTPDLAMLGDTWRLPFWGRMLMYSSRGCPYKCLFCSGARFWHNYRFFSTEYLIREIEWRNREYGTRYFDFWDDLFIGNDDRFKRFTEMFLERGLQDKVTLAFSVRSNLVTAGRAKAFRELGVENVNFGAESGSDRVLAAAGKRGVSVEANQRAIDLLHEQGIYVNCSFIMGFPDETYREMKQTVQFIQRNKSKLSGIGVYPLLPFPGTIYWDLAYERGIVSLDMDWSAFEMEYSRLNFDKLLYLNTQVSRRRFASLFRQANELGAEIGDRHHRYVFTQMQAAQSS